MKQSLILILICLLMTGCASVNSLSMSSVPADRSNPVSAQATRWIILGLNFNNDYADAVAKDLSQKCPHGKISGILTKDELDMYFLFFVVQKKVTATGFCDRQVATSSKSRPASKRKNSSDEEGLDL